MNESSCEPRRTMWAVAQVSWVDTAGVARSCSATLEDISPSGACLRVQHSIAPGASVNVKWHREQFQAVAKNCRSDGYEFLLGVRREANLSGVQEHDFPEKPQKSNPAGAVSLIAANANVVKESAKAEKIESPIAAPVERPTCIQKVQIDEVRVTSTIGQEIRFLRQYAAGGMNSMRPVVDRIAQGPRNEMSSGREKKVMESKNRFPKFWRREPNASSATETTSMKENPVDNMHARPADSAVGSKSSLLSYDDIYRAAGILRPGSGYDINKVVEMLHCERIRNLSDDARRASVLMAIEAVGAAPDDLLRDAQQRQQALDAYEAGQKKVLEDFEARRVKDNAEIEAELARVSAHYAERIRVNLDQVAAEKEALRNWQMVKQHESQRIAEVIDLCVKPAETQPAAMAASASVQATSAAPRPTGPSLVPPGSPAK